MFGLRPAGRFIGHAAREPRREHAQPAHRAERRAQRARVGEEPDSGWAEQEADVAERRDRADGDAGRDVRPRRGRAHRERIDGGEPEPERAERRDRRRCARRGRGGGERARSRQQPAARDHPRAERGREPVPASRANPMVSENTASPLAAVPGAASWTRVRYTALQSLSAPSASSTQNATAPSPTSPRGARASPARGRVGPSPPGGAAGAAPAGAGAARGGRGGARMRRGGARGRRGGAGGRVGGEAADRERHQRARRGCRWPAGARSVGRPPVRPGRPRRRPRARRRRSPRAVRRRSGAGRGTRRRALEC